jgi:hypothetical protein
MAIGTVTKYNQFLDIIMGTDNRQWDDVSAGSDMFVLATGVWSSDIQSFKVFANL